MQAIGFLDYGDLEDELCTQLNNFFTANGVDDLFFAVAVPENTKQQQTIISDERAIILVQYIQTEPGIVNGIGNGVRQDETVTIRFLFNVQTLRGVNGYYKAVKYVKYVLLGYRPNGCTEPLTISKYDLLSYENNLLVNSMDMKTETPIVKADWEETPIGGNGSGIITSNP